MSAARPIAGWGRVHTCQSESDGDSEDAAGGSDSGEPSNRDSMKVLLRMKEQLNKKLDILNDAERRRF